MNETQLLLSAQRAMIFNISPKFRMISIEIDNNAILNVMVVISGELSESEKDLAYSLAGEIEGDYPEILATDVKFLEDNREIDQLPRLRTLIYSLYQ